jgi:hypothetical protein
MWAVGVRKESFCGTLQACHVSRERDCAHASCRDGSFQLKGGAVGLQAWSIEQAQPEVPHHRESST